MDPEDVLLARYRECWREISDYDRLIWQTPTVTVAIVSFFAIAYVQSLNNSSAEFVLSLSAFAITFAQFHALTKHRLLQEVRVRDFEELQKRVESIPKVSKYEIFWKTEQVADSENGKIRYRKELQDRKCWLWWHKIKAYRLMKVLLLLFLFAWAILAIFHAYGVVCSCQGCLIAQLAGCPA